MSLFRNFSLQLKLICLLIGCFSQCTRAQDISDKDFIQKYDEIINKVACDAMAQTDGAQMKVNLSRYSTHEELARLAFWNYGNNFSHTQLTFPEDINWKRELVNSLFEIFKLSCATEYVSHEFMNIFRELAMIYLNSAEPRDTKNAGAWDQIKNILNTCKGDIVSYDLKMRGFNVFGISDQVGDQIETVELYPPQEQVDVVFSDVDLVVDNLWWVFSHALGKCYPKMETPAIVAPKLKTLFVRDILRPLLNRWGDPGPLQNFSPIVGNFDIVRAQRNMRFCVTAAYFRNGIAELQMVRPLKVGYDIEGINSIINKKTGATFE